MQALEMEIRPGPGERVEARFGTTVVTTDQDGSAPSPMDLFLAALGTCAGFYVSRFCRQRGIAIDGLRLVQRVVPDAETGLAARIVLEIRLPEGFPERYREAVVRAAGACAVKRHVEHAPAFEVSVA